MPVSIEEDERKLWEEAKRRRAEIEKNGMIVADEALTRYLNGVLATLMAEPLSEQAPVPGVHVLRSPQRNAYAAPDGGILVSTGMLAAIQNEAQLAALLGHELGHFIARHGLMRQRFEKLSGSSVERMQLSRDNEAYCDRFALEVMRRAGYDPREIVLLNLQLTEPDDAGWAGGWTVLRSHPFTAERIRALQEPIGHAREDDVRTERERYNEAIAPLLPVAAEVE
ncbi:MAG: M48 family metalloprotease [Deltaproteobacteria bacterium]|nr:M48 family metalloprotease [Deltaproteobacteria bacterium]